MTYSTTAQACMALRISKIRLNELARKGKLPRGPRANQWDIEACRAALEANLDIKQPSPARGDVPRGSVGRKGQVKVAARAVATEAQDQETFSNAQTRKEIASANMKEMEEGEKRKALIPAEEVRDAVNGMVVSTRAKLLVIGDELSDKLAATSDAIKCREMVDARIYEVLSVLAEYPANAA